MKVILSKKGLDSTDGNSLPNLIWEDEFIVFPMPDKKEEDVYKKDMKNLKYTGTQLLNNKK